MNQGQTQAIQTDWGPVELREVVEPGQLDGLVMDDGFGQFDRFRSFFGGIDSLKRQLARPGTLLSVAVLDGRAIIAYALLRPAMADERWAECADPPMLELIVEAARQRRGGHIVRPLLQMLIQRPENEDRVLYLVGYCWTWDIDASGKTMAEYRQTLKNLVAPMGFREYPTNEPNVALRPDNLFMARLGATVEADRGRKRRFSNLLFGIKENW